MKLDNRNLHEMLHRVQRENGGTGGGGGSGTSKSMLLAAKSLEEPEWRTNTRSSTITA